MPLIDPTAPYAIRIGVHIAVFLFAIVSWAILGDMVAPGTTRSAMSTRVVYTFVSAIALVLLTSQDMGFFYAGIAVITSGVFQTLGVFTGPEQLAIVSGAFGVVIGSAYFLSKAAPGAITNSVYNDY